jgi:transcriptional regulator with XRE-family HTH domain
MLVKMYELVHIVVMKFNSTKAKALIDASPYKERVIAERCTIKLRSLKTYLRGDGTPSAAVVRLLAQALEVPESELTSTDIETPKAS